MGWRYTHGSPHRHSYDNRDDETRAERFFVTVHCQMGRFTVIDPKTYQALVQQYEAKAKQTPQPADDA